jgi:hypothetical protein
MNIHRTSRLSGLARFLGSLITFSLFLLFIGGNPAGSTEAPAGLPAEFPGTPLVRPIQIPSFPGSYAIWGATGSDSRGHIWVGVSSRGIKVPSAHLFEFVPETDKLIDRGDVVSALKGAGLWRQGEGQQKIHSKIVQSSDGHLYFASMDEQGENEDGSKLPTWGSHMWRLKMPGLAWEHLFSAPQGLIAVGGGAGYVYALGYFDHVLYQFDTRTGKTRSVRVGSVDGHISRNFLCDARGHVYVPRLLRQGEIETSPIVTLVEFDAELKEVGQTTLKHYLLRNPTLCHGIVAFQMLADGSICFVTHVGFLYRVIPNDTTASEVREVGWIHPKGKSYTASLFTQDGARYLYAQSRASGEKQYDWLKYDLESRSATISPFEVNGTSLPPIEQGLLYGSSVKDFKGHFYVVGTFYGKGIPLLLKVSVGH